MRPASSRLATLWITVLCLVAVTFSLQSLVSAQTAGSQQKLSKRTLHSRSVTGLALRRSSQPGTPPPTTTDTWQGGASGNWNNAANWNNGLPSGDNVLINLGTAATTVDASFSIGTLTLSNAGDSVGINNNTTLTVGGNIVNNGTISLNSVGNGTFLDIGAAGVTLSGSGTLNLGSTTNSNINNIIIGGATADTLTNSSTIAGGGNIGDNQMTLVNSGTINANQVNVLTIQANGGVTNTGTLEATTGTLLLQGDSGAITINNSGGTIKATGADVQLVSGVIVNGGTLTTLGTGLIHTLAGNTATLENLTNAGNFQLDNNTITNVIGTITNNGNINFASVGNGTDMELTGNVTLNGTGTITMSNNTNNRIYGAVATDVLTIGSGQTLSGAGQIGLGQMALVNNGIIDANQPSSLTIFTNNGTTNNKTLEATNGGTLILQGTIGDVLTNTTGTITAAAGSTVTLENGIVVNGGTISSTGTGLLHTLNTSTLENLTISGTYQQDNNSATVLVGTIIDNGNINLVSAGNATDLQLSGNVTLNGSGTLTMSPNVNNRIYGVSGAGTEVLTNNINISGAGQIGVGQTVINNTSLGTINANQSGQTLTIVPSVGGATNSGLMEATAGGTLILQGSFTNKVGSTSGTILANGGTVNLNSNTTVTGGTLQSKNAGVIQIVGSNTLLDGSTSLGAVTLATGTSLQVLNNTALSVQGSTVNNGTINLNSAGNATELIAAGPAGTNTTLSGTGTLVLSNNTNNYIFGSSATNTFTNQQTISGSGVIGDNQMILVNQGTINANGSTGLTINPSGGTTNTGLIEATATGILNLSGSTITNTGANIEAIGATGTGNGATVNLQNSVVVTGGTLTSNQFGSFNVVNNATLSGLTLAGTVNVLNNTSLNLMGTIVNNGTITLNSGGNATELLLNGNVTLNGTGTINLSNNTNNYIFGTANGDTLTVANTQTIQGSGVIGDNQMVLVNNGTINDNQSSSLTINPNGGTTNTGTIEASNGGTLVLSGDAFTNTGAGKLIANSGSTVVLDNSVVVTGGTLSGSGIFQETNNATLSGLTNSSTIQVLNNTSLNLMGTITNNGTIQENSGGNLTEILLSGNVTLKGTGSLVMTDNSNNYIFGQAGTDILTNASTISGAGHIGDAQMSLVNSGTINATGTNALAINVSGTVNNTGTFEATNSGGLTVTAPANGFLNYTTTNNTLTGGTYIANGGNVILPLGTTGGITTLAATVVEENGSQILNSNNSNANALNGLTGITSKGALTIGGVAFTDPGAFSNAGSLTLLSGESFNVGSLTQISGTTLTAGTYVLDSNLNLTGTPQNITTNAATLTLAGGTIENTNGNALKNLATNTGKLTIGGGSTFTTVGNFSNTGTLTINGGSAFTLGGGGTLAQISGSTLSAGTFVLGGNLNVGSGINITTNSATLTMDGGTIESGSTNALTNLATNTKSLTLAGNANFTTTGNFTNSGTLTVNNGSTFTVLNGKSLTNYHNTGTTANTLVGGTYTIAGTLAFNAGTTGAIKTDSANITLEGSGLLMNTSAGAASTNALANLATISSTGAFTLAQNANFTAAGAFTNSGRLTVNSGSTLSLTGSNLLTNLSAGTLSGGTYTIGGTLQLTSANGGITTNAANLTLTGTSAKILDGTSNALANFNNNTGTFAVTGNGSFTSAPTNFTNSGTVTIAKGSTFVIGGSGKNYTQTAGQTTIDGTLTGNGGGLVSATGGTMLGAGTVKGNVSIGNATGTAATLNVGDTGVAGLLSITGKYTQLATGNLTGFVNGTTAGTGFSQLKVTGTAALAGTINYTVSSSFQAGLTVGQTFTVLTASAVSGTFSNSTIAINSSFHFTVSYTATGVVLTVASGPVSAPNSMPVQSAAQSVAAKPVVRASAIRSSAIPSRGLPQRAPRTGAVRTTAFANPILVASSGPRSGAIVNRSSEAIGLRSWQHTPVTPVAVKPITVSRVSVGNVNSLHNSLATAKTWIGGSRGIGSASSFDSSINRRVPVKIMPTALPHVTR